MESSIRMRLLLAVAACAAAGGAGAQVHKCVDAQGKTTYQSRPCDGAPPSTAVQPTSPPPASSTPPAPAAAPKASPVPARPAPAAGAPVDAQVEAQAKVLAHRYATCSVFEPAYRERVAKDYGRFRESYAAFVEPYERSAVFAQDVASMRKFVAENAAENTPSALQARQSQMKECANYDQNFNVNWGAPDPRLATPEGALQAFIAAVRVGNKRAVLEASAGRVGADFAESPDGGRARYARVAGWVLVRMEPARDSAIAHMRTPEGVARRVGLVQVNGNWRVSDAGA